MSLSGKDDLETTSLPSNAIPTDTKDGLNATETIDEEETTYPDGGLRAWLVVLGSFCGMCAHPLFNPPNTQSLPAD